MHNRFPRHRQWAVSLGLAGVTGLLSHAALAQSPAPDASAQGESLSADVQSAKQGAYLSDWYNRT